MFYLFICNNSYISWLLLYLFRSVPQSSLRICLLGLSPQYVCQVKHNSQPLGCTLFFSVDSFGDYEGMPSSLLSFAYEDPECGTKRDLLCPSVSSESPDKFQWAFPGSWISHYWLLIQSFIWWCLTSFWRNRLSLKFSFKKRYLSLSWKELGRFCSLLTLSRLSSVN